MEERYLPAKLKRKDLEQVNDDFSDFSLSSPATKMRRLDAELPPIIDEEEMVNPVTLGQPEAIDDLLVNEERAIVLYDPMNNIPSRSPFSFSVNSDFLSGFKNPVLWSNRSHLLESLNGGKEKQDEQNKNDGSLAVVPWVPMHSQHQSMAEVEIPCTGEVSEMMDIEEDDDNSQRVDHMNEYGSLNQWQQHCMIPHNFSTPIAWSGTGI
ncbi:hypothetical protein SSX86_005216 [Deinandra increscens subsp. villosa]|uniref:Uncharacterized protein n=1 Tax=Deinandra increscens subsp. villosa TaxID=3103831 RepID=A0AAP0DLI7_9ASTR